MMISWSDSIAILLLLAVVAASIRWKRLTVPAALTGGLQGGLIYAGAGYTGLWMLGVFFVLATAATSWKKKTKRLLPANDSAQTTRRTGQVLANGGVAALAGLGIFLFPASRPLLLVMMAASLSAAMADTWSSELGMVYGRRFYNILTGKPDEKGRDGVISVEGSLIGLAGSAIMGLLYLSGSRELPGPKAGTGFGIVVVAGTVGNLLDSFLGATLERRGVLSNDTVNFLNTLAAAVLAGILASII